MRKSQDSLKEKLPFLKEKLRFLKEGLGFLKEKLRVLERIKCPPPSYKNIGTLNFVTTLGGSGTLPHKYVGSCECFFCSSTLQPLTLWRGLTFDGRVNIRFQLARSLPLFLSPGL